MKKSTPVSYDVLFKTFFTHPGTARDFLQFHLPVSLLEKCDLSSLRVVPGRYIEATLLSDYSEVLYSVKTWSGDAYIYCLLQHPRRTPNQHVAFWLMQAAITVMQKHLHSGAGQLPLVMPLLFCQDKAQSSPLNWIDLFPNPALAQQFYTHDFPLADVLSLPDNVIMNHRRMATLELLLKHIYTRELTALMPQLITLLTINYMTRDQLHVLIRWMLQTGDAGEPEAFLLALASHLPQHKEVFLNIAQQFEHKGHLEGLKLGEERGIRLGIAKGVEQGRLDAALCIATTMLQNGMDKTTVMKMTGLSEEWLTQARMQKQTP